MEKENICFLWRRRKTEKENIFVFGEENWRMKRKKICLWRRKKNREGKEEKYLEKENIFLPRKSKTEKEENNIFAEEKKIGVGKEENIWRRKMLP